MCIRDSFSAHWCPPCKMFTPQLAKIYNDLKAKGLKFEVVYISRDSDQAAWNEYYAEMPWLALPYSDRERAEALQKKYSVEGIPMLLLLDKDGGVITSQGRSAVQNDPSGKEWIPGAKHAAPAPAAQEKDKACCSVM
eukprot:TRINITY_DN12662_c0_g1_i1.p1 TRINITY_DN12662_c0_g1~~TRINITY_DN12662_c0_g1_i1.p1  ORF type:complete len:137 (+),score=31.38 TRINITY_DN12662_c0_g1_i1:158-568(+)